MEIWESFAVVINWIQFCIEPSILTCLVQQFSSPFENTFAKLWYCFWLLPLLCRPLLVIPIHCVPHHHLPLTISQLRHGLGKGKQHWSFLLRQVTLLITMTTAAATSTTVAGGWCQGCTFGGSCMIAQLLQQWLQLSVRIRHRPEGKEVGRSSIQERCSALRCLSWSFKETANVCWWGQQRWGSFVVICHGTGSKRGSCKRMDTILLLTNTATRIWQFIFIPTALTLTVLPPLGDDLLKVRPHGCQWVFNLLRHSRSQFSNKVIGTWSCLLKVELAVGGRSNWVEFGAVPQLCNYFKYSWRSMRNDWEKGLC